jgi:hypothetical protein
MAEQTPAASAAPEKGAGKPKGKRARAGKKEKKSIPHGLATVAASFNNTIVSIADQEGNILAWSSAGRIGFKGSRKGTPFAAQLAAANCAEHAKEHGVRRRPGVGDPRPPGQRHRHQVDQGFDADPPQRLPSAQAAEGLGNRDLF